jgi:hypothetical protein
LKSVWKAKKDEKNSKKKSTSRKKA